MSLESKISKNVFQGNGTTKTFSFSFRVWKEDQVLVYVGIGDETETDVTSSCSITLSENGGTVTFPTAPADGTTIAVVRNMPFIQEDQYITGARFDPHEIEDRLDQDCAERQQLLDGVERAIKVPVTSDKTPEQYMGAFWQAVKNVLASIVEAGKNIGNSTYVTAKGSDTPRTLADRFGDVVNVKDFGAVGDGVTDDTVSFQKAIETEQYVFVPYGKYSISEQIDFTKLYGFGTVIHLGQVVDIPSTVSISVKQKEVIEATKDIDKRLDGVINQAGQNTTDIEALTAKADKNETDIAAANSRIDSLMSLPGGSTSLDAEVIDIRIGQNGTSYATAGEAVRKQVEMLLNLIEHEGFGGNATVQYWAEQQGNSIALSSVADQGVFPSGDTSKFTVTDFPSGMQYAPFFVINFVSATDILQVIVSIAGSKISYRYIQRGVTKDWRYVGSYPSGNLSSMYAGMSISLTDLPYDGVYLTGSRAGYTILDAPFDGNFYIINYMVYWYKLQVCYGTDNNKYAWRHVDSQGTALPWNITPQEDDSSGPNNTDVKLVAIGDSLTRARISKPGGQIADDDTYGYMYKLNRRYLNYTLTTRGIVGIGLVAVSQGMNALQQITKYSSDIADADIVTIALGTNDYNQSKPLGDVDTSVVNDGTICGNLKGCLEAVSEINSNCNVHFLAPFMSTRGGKETSYSMGRVNSAGYTQRVMNDAIEKVCVAYGVSFIDLSKIGAITAGNAEASLPDGTHPSEEAYERIAHALYCHFM